MSLADYLLNSKSSIVQYETIQLSHSDFSKTYYFVRNNTKGITAVDEDENVIEFSYLPMFILRQTTSDDLDYSLEIEFGDLGEVLAAEFDLIFENDGLTEEPVLTYRTYRSDNLLVPLIGPVNLQVKAFAFNAQGAVFQAIGKQTNRQRTGEIYTLEQFPMLVGFKDE